MRHLLAVVVLVVTSIQVQTAAARDVTVIGATDRDRTELDWALDRFERAKLDLPRIVIEFHSNRDHCDGAAGVFRGSERPRRIEICVPNRYVIMHELAHAWDHHNLDDATRRAFMELQGVAVWNDHDTAWGERGVEALAETITWGLYAIDLTASADERSDKAAAYALLTGCAPRRIAHSGIEAPAGFVEDPAEAEPGWNAAR